MAVKTIKIEKPEDLALIILNQRKKSKLSRNKLALIAGVGRTAIFDIEHGKTTYQIDTLIKILSVLNLNLCIEGIILGDLD
jgi:HTH-type transcriptional regulator/antitoxin HipB